MALRLATRAAEDAGPETPRTLYRATGAAPERLTPTRARVLKAAEGGVAFAKKALAEAAACSAGVIDALVDEGALEAIAAPPRADRAAARPSIRRAGAGARAARRRRCAEGVAFRPRAFKPFLLEGVTGSGKTEVYFEAIAAGAGGTADRRSS